MVAAVALAIFSPLLACRHARAVADRPPVLLIVIDTLRADFLGATGFRGDISPAIDRFARESTLFEECHALAPWTKPSMASVFTSLPPELHGVTNHEGHYGDGPPTAATTVGILVPQALTLAEVLQQAGYRTAAFNANPWMLAKYGFAQGFDTYAEYGVRDTPQILADAEAWLRPRLFDDAPRFLYLHFMDVHAPYHGPRADYEALRASPSYDATTVLRPEAEAAIPAYLDGDPRLSADERHALGAWRAKYAAGVRAIDRQLGTFLDHLRRDGILDRAVVVLLADHGEELFDHGGWDHGYTLYEELLHVPLLVHRPHGDGAGRRVHGPASLLDVMPTVLTLAHVAVPPGLDGRDLAPVLTGGGDVPTPGTGALASAVLHRPGLRAFRSERYKLITDRDGDEAHVFDMIDDPGEHDDLAPRRPDLVRELRARLDDRLSALAARAALPAASGDVDAAAAARLRSLGYLR